MCAAHKEAQPEQSELHNIDFYLDRHTAMRLSIAGIFSFIQQDAAVVLAQLIFIEVPFLLLSLFDFPIPFL